MIEAKKIPQFVPDLRHLPVPARWANRPAGFDCDLSGGKFGPFEKQLFVGDQTHSTIMRVILEKVNGRYQGACYPFRQGFGCGIVPVCFAPDGSLIVGGTNRGWGSRGNKPFAVERLAWTGKVPFEIHEMQAKPDGFELTFTKPIDPKTAGDVASYKMRDFHLHLPGGVRQPRSRSHEADHHEGRRRRRQQERAALRGASWRKGTSTTLTAAGVRSAEGSPLLHNIAYYTMNYIPEAKKD